MIVLYSYSEIIQSGQRREAVNFKYRTWAEIDLDAIEYNYKTLRDILPQGADICCVVKADAYGHGATRVAALLEQIGVSFFAVSSIDEALELRRANIRSKILVLGYTPPSDAATLVEYDISQCVYSLDYARLLASCAIEKGVKISVHVKIDVGMGRLGFVFRHGVAESLDGLCEACGFSCFNLEGIFTHFPTADEDAVATKRQFENFCGVIEALEGRGYTFTIKHCANSATALNHPELCLNMVRAGILLYGALPTENMAPRIALRPTITLKTVISNLKTVRKGDTIGYGASFVAPRNMKIATLPIGYADGLLRANSDNGTPIMINRKPCRIVGRICMDQTMVEVDGAGELNIGDEATVFGGAVGLSLSDFARVNHTIPYEILTTLSSRVPRIYVRDGKIEEK